MKIINRIILSLAAAASVSTTALAANPNVVIQQLDHTYKLVPAKGGEKLDRVDITEQTTFRANRKEDTAIATAYYGSYVKFNKASGGEVASGVLFNDDVFFDDSKATIVKADLKKAGATAKVSISTTYTKPEFFSKVYLVEPYAVENATYTFEIPASMESRFSFEPRNVPAGKMTETTERKGDKVIKRFTLTDMPEPKHFSDAPSRNVCAPQIIIHGQFSDVDDLYRYLQTYIDPVDPGAAAVEAKARELTADCKTDAERIDAISRFVHDNIRYVAVEHGEYGQKPDLPSEVLRKLYGDCKGSGSLLAAMFRAVGLDGRRVWIGTTSIADRWTDLPALCSGNHMISCVVFPGDSILFVDGTASSINPPQLPTGIQGQQALIENGPDKCLIATVPHLPASANTWKSDFTVTLDPEGNQSAEGTLTLSGFYNTMIVETLRATPPARHDKIFSKLLLQELNGKTAEVGKFDRQPDSSTLTGTVTGFNVVKHVGNELYVDLNPMPDIANYKYETKERTEPGYQSENSTLDQSLTLVVPDGLSATDLPAPVEIKNKYLTATVTTEQSDDGRRVTRRIVLQRDRGIIPLEELKSYNADIARLQRACTASVILK